MCMQVWVALLLGCRARCNQRWPGNDGEERERNGLLIWDGGRCLVHIYTEVGCMGLTILLPFTISSSLSMLCSQCLKMTSGLPWEECQKCRKSKLFSVLNIMQYGITVI